MLVIIVVSVSVLISFLSGGSITSAKMLACSHAPVTYVTQTQIKCLLEYGYSSVRHGYVVEKVLSFLSESNIQVKC